MRDVSGMRQTLQKSPLSPTQKSSTRVSGLRSAPTFGDARVTATKCKTAMFRNPQVCRNSISLRKRLGAVGEIRHARAACQMQHPMPPHISATVQRSDP